MSGQHQYDVMIHEVMSIVLSCCVIRKVSYVYLLPYAYGNLIKFTLINHSLCLL
jgi:hypothetical protein